ncbi:TPA: hypothetical protein ACGW3W_002192 [Pseudomonas aeruginosa]
MRVIGAVNAELDISPEDEARYLQIMADYEVAMRDFYRDPVPMCHFSPMTFHADDSESGGDGYQCDHCGHTEDSAEAWAKVHARQQAKA